MTPRSVWWKTVVIIVNLLQHNFFCGSIIFLFFFPILRPPGAGISTQNICLQKKGEWKGKLLCCDWFFKSLSTQGLWQWRTQRYCWKWHVLAQEKLTSCLMTMIQALLCYAFIIHVARDKWQCENEYWYIFSVEIIDAGKLQRECRASFNLQPRVESSWTNGSVVSFGQ